MYLAILSLDCGVPRQNEFVHPGTVYSVLKP
jgi:hypothetical protein